MFDDFDDLVASFMDDFGFTATYIRTISSTPNDTTGTVDIVTENISINAIKMELIRPMNASSAIKSGTLIQDGDQILYVQPTEKADSFTAALIVNPSADKILINNDMWSIVTCKEYNPTASDNILYELYIRK